ncbi:septal ring lytic transglycosylase RlpA family protein [Patescibacteria group bacterium]|nr:septal ring lytic transglycosylase RlpA family protein [Patescibacteria group bacterium]
MIFKKEILPLLIIIFLLSNTVNAKSIFLSDDKDAKNNIYTNSNLIENDVKIELEADTSENTFFTVLNDLKVKPEAKEGMKIISNLYELKLFSTNGVDLQKPYLLKFKYNTENKSAKRYIYFYNEYNQTWNKVNFSEDTGEEIRVNLIHQKYAKFAILEEIHTVEKQFIGEATYYGGHGFFDGRPTKSGEIFDSTLMTAAMNLGVKMGTMAKVTNLENNKEIIVKINDTGGFSGKTVIDLSKGAFSELANPSQGRINVKVEILKNY